MVRDLTIAAFLGVKDEKELIEYSIQHLRAIGVDLIIACDMSSTDGTQEILERLKAPDLLVFSLGNASLDPRSAPEQQWEAQARNWYTTAPCDWILFLDADEFWLPATGNLKDCGAFYRSDVLNVERYNIVLGPNGPHMKFSSSRDVYDQTYLYVRTMPNFHIAKQTHARAMPWIRGTPEQKIAARRSKIKDIELGQHDAVVDTNSRRERPDDLLVAHLALSTLTRFERKVENIREIYSGAGVDLTQPEETWKHYGTAWHWRRWAAMSDLSSEFRDNSVSGEEIAALRGVGEIQTVSEVLRRRWPRFCDAFLRLGRTIYIELEYGSMFRPCEVVPGSDDRRLLAVRFRRFDFSCKESGYEFGGFDLLAQHPHGWRDLFGLSSFEPDGRWSLGPRSGFVFSLASAAPRNLLLRISHTVARPYLSNVSARLRVNGGAWRQVTFEGEMCAVDIDIAENGSIGPTHNLSLDLDGSPSLSIIVVTHNQPELTFAAIVAIEAAQIDRAYEIIVVDNASTPDHREQLANMALPVRRIETTELLSFGTANNLAAEAARGELLLLLNNDAFLVEGVVERLTEELVDRRVGLVGPVFRFPDGALQEAGGFVSADGLTTSPILNGLNWDRPEVSDVDYVSAACVMLRRADFLRVGGFDPLFERAYSEDVDLCLRLRLAGMLARVVSSVSIHHIRGATTSAMVDSHQINAIKHRNLLVLRSRLAGVIPAVKNTGSAVPQIDLSRLEQQIQRFPEQRALHFAKCDDRPMSVPDRGAFLAHAVALSCLRPVMVASNSCRSILDLRSRLRHLGLVYDNLTSSGEGVWEGRPFDVMLISEASFPPATTPCDGARRILHCPGPNSVEDADIATLRARLGNLLNFDVIVTDSEFSRRACYALLDRLRAPQIDIEVVDGPVDVFTPDELAFRKENIIVSFGPLQRGPRGGAHEIALTAFRKFSMSYPDRRWTLVIVGNLPHESDTSYVDVLRARESQLDVEVLVEPTREIFRRLLARSKIYISLTGLSAGGEDRSGLSHSSVNIGAAISAGCLPLAYHAGAEAEFLEREAIGYLFRDENELLDRLLDAAWRADAGGISADHRNKMFERSSSGHAKSWENIVSGIHEQNQPSSRVAPALVVVGCQGSGMSLMTRLLSLAGADLPTNLVAPECGASDMLWEPAEISKFNEDYLESRGLHWNSPPGMSSSYITPPSADELNRARELITAGFPGNRPIVLKEPRISILTKLWDTAIAAAQYQPKYIILVRDPHQVAAALAARHRFPVGKSFQLWSTYMLTAELDTRMSERTFISYDDLISNPIATLERISTELSVSLPRKSRVERHSPECEAEELSADCWSPTFAAPFARLRASAHEYFEALRAAARGERLSNKAAADLQERLMEFTTYSESEFRHSQE